MTSSLRSRLRDKVPELILEAVSVVLAVLLALAVDQWREGRRNDRMANRAQVGVQDEIGTNRDELARNAERNRAIEQALAEALANQSWAGDADADDDGLTVNFSVSLLSSAAWQTAQVTLAVHHLDYPWVSRVSQLYELQNLYLRRQDSLVDYIATLTVEGDGEVELRSLRGRLTTVLALQDALLEAYGRLLEAP